MLFYSMSKFTAILHRCPILYFFVGIFLNMVILDLVVWGLFFLMLVFYGHMRYLLRILLIISMNQESLEAFVFTQ